MPFVGARRDGASGFLLKDTPPPKIVEAVHRVLTGEPILSPSESRSRACLDPSIRPSRRR
jgi:DNA-binding NarL/FixJ family response regulator